MKDHKKMQGVYLRAGFFSSLVIFVMLFTFVPYHEPKPYELKEDIIGLSDTIFTMLDPIDEPPPPQDRPKIAVEPDPQYGDSVVETIPITDFVENPINVRPIGPDIEIVPYYRVEVKPVLVKSAMPTYPELAKRAGIEGVTSVKMLVDIDGSVMEVEISKSSGNGLLDQAAVHAARQHKFSPAKQRDRLVRVWVSRRFTFRLTG